MNESLNMSAALARERQLLIQSRLASNGRVIAADLAREFATSDDTIRRDLRLLARAGQCRRVYGGALPMSPASGPIGERREQDRDAKARLAAVAVRLLRPGQCVVLDASSTNRAIAVALPEDLPLTVVTNAVSIAAVLQDRAAIALIILGGRHDRATGGALGLTTIRAAERLRPDLYFIGACALDPVAGLTVFNAEEADLKRTLAETGAALAVTMTDAKLATVAPHGVVPWAALHHVVVEGPHSLPGRIGPLPAGGPLVHLAAGGAHP